MQEHIGRRRFLKTIGMGAAAVGGAEALLPSMAASFAEEANPYASNFPRLLPGCCAYSFGKEFTGGEMTWEKFVATAVELRVNAVDITAYYLKSTDDAYLADIRHLAYKNGMALSGAACGVSMVQADPAKRAASLTDIKKWIDVTDRLGAPHLRVFAGKLPAGATIEQATDWVVETMKPAADYAAQKGIMLGLEDHSGVSQSADVCLEIVHRVNSPYAGINLDITHFTPSPTQDEYAQIEACVPYATHTHIRDLFDDHTPIDMDRVWRIFAKAGYKGYMSAEYESSFSPGNEPVTAGLPKLIDKIRALCRKYSTV